MRKCSAVEDYARRGACPPLGSGGARQNPPCQLAVPNRRLVHVHSFVRRRRIWPNSPAVDIICAEQEDVDPVAARLGHTNSCETNNLSDAGSTKGVVVEMNVREAPTGASHLTLEQLEAGLEEIQRSPADGGPLRMIVQRPAVDERQVVEIGELDVDTGLVGDSWKTRGSRSTPDGSADPAAQLNIMNSRALALLAQSKDRWQLAGDQLIIDLDMSVENLPHGTRLSIGSAVIEVTEKPHTGCAKFAERFGKDGPAEIHQHPNRQPPPASRRLCKSRSVGTYPRRRFGYQGHQVDRLYPRVPQGCVLEPKQSP